LKTLHQRRGGTAWGDRLRVGWLNGFSGRGTTRAEDAQGTPTQSHISPSTLASDDKTGSSRRLLLPRRNLSRANMAQVRQSRTDSGLGVQVKVLKIVSCSLFARKRYQGSGVVACTDLPLIQIRGSKTLKNNTSEGKWSVPRTPKYAYTSNRGSPHDPHTPLQRGGGKHPNSETLHGYLAQKKSPPPRTLQ